MINKHIKIAVGLVYVVVGLFFAVESTAIAIINRHIQSPWTALVCTAVGVIMALCGAWVLFAVFSKSKGARP